MGLLDRYRQRQHQQATEREMPASPLSPPLSDQDFLAAAMRVFDGEIVQITLGRAEADRQWQARLAASRQPPPAAPETPLALTPFGERFMARARVDDAGFAVHGPAWWQQPACWNNRRAGLQDQPPACRPDRRARWSFKAGGIEAFWRFCTERQRMNVRRYADRQPWPWTEDAILSQHRFTGPYRAFDRGTRFIAVAALEQPLSLEERLWAVLLYRQYNLPGTYTLLADEGLASMTGFDPERVSAVLLARQQRKQPVFSAAYRIVNAGGSGAGATLRQSVRDLEVARQRLPELLAALQTADSSQQAISVLKQSCPGLGDPRNAGASFYAHERLQDLADGAVLAPNVLTHLDLAAWCYVGPGAANALSREMGIPREEYQQAMQVLREEQPSDFPGPRFSTATVEFALCEFSKYQRISRQDGFKRRPYSPRPFDERLYPPAVIERFCRPFDCTKETKVTKEAHT